jgi:hypothetical protein
MQQTQTVVYLIRGGPNSTSFGLPLKWVETGDSGSESFASTGVNTPVTAKMRTKHEVNKSSPELDRCEMHHAQTFFYFTAPFFSLTLTMNS